MSVITRSQWGAVHGRGNPTSGAKTRFIVHHDGNDRLREDSTPPEEVAVMRMFERFHASHLTAKNPRIAYSFVIAPSGRIYEGCGWGQIGAHTAGLNSSAYAVQHPINGQVTKPTAAALEAQAWLRAEGIQLGHLTPAHVVSGHRDHGSTSCPGRLVYEAAVLGVSAIVTPTAREAVAARPSLRRGKGGRGAPADITAAVLAVQTRLLELGFLSADKLATGPGTFGPATDRAVCAFQQTKGLVVDGIIGPVTWRALDI